LIFHYSTTNYIPSTIFFKVRGRREEGALRTLKEFM